MESIHLLLVEDNETDVRIFTRAMEKAGVSYPITVAYDGIEALAILRGGNGAMPLDRPNVVLLDLNMPRMNGLEFLNQVRADPALADLVIFVLTTSDAPKDKAEAYSHHIAGYVLKSDPGHSFKDAIEMFDRFARVVELPI